MSFRTLALAAFASSPWVSAQGVTVLHGNPSGLASVETLNAGILGQGLPVSGLQNVELVPLDVVGRTALNAADPSAPRLQLDVPGGRVLLPQEGGSLYRFRREELSGDVFGHFLVQAGGRVRLLEETPGTGSTGSDDPYVHRVAASADGLGLLVATTPAAGGVVFEVGTNGTLERRTPVGLAVDVLPGGMALLPDWGAFLTPQGPWIFDRQPLSEASLVRPAPGEGQASQVFRYFGPDLVTSADGSRVAFVAGASADAAWVWTLDRQGVARRVDTVPRELSNAGFLPECAFGPTLALAPDGTAVAWRAEVDGDYETFLRVLRPNGPTTQLTAAVRFNDTLDDSGVLAFYSPTELISLIGETGANGVSEADFYSFRIDAAGDVASIVNLSRTSGDLTLPFDEYGELSSEPGLVGLPGTGIVIVRNEGPADDLVLVEPRGSQGPRVLLSGIESLEFGIQVGDETVLGTRRTSTGNPLEFWRWRASQPGSLRFVAMAGPSKGVVGFLGTEAGRFAATTEAPGGRKLGRLDVLTGEGELLAPLSPVLASSLESLVDGTIVGTVNLASGARWFLWEPSDRLRFSPPRTGTLNILPSL